MRVNVNDVARPFEQSTALYRTGIAVGDYPVDHHHQAYPEAASLPKLHFYPVPSYCLPLGTLIPGETEDFIVAEKSISVTNIVNGTTRLQPVCMLIGQAAGTLAALSVQEKITPSQVPVRTVQKALLQAGAYVMPYSDIDKNAPAFQSFQRIGATGILKGEGKNIGWANHTHIYPDSLMTRKELHEGLNQWIDNEKWKLKTELVAYNDLLKLIKVLGKQHRQPCGRMSKKQLQTEAQTILQSASVQVPEQDQPVNRTVVALLLDKLINPFEIRPVDHSGNFM